MKIIGVKRCTDFAYAHAFPQPAWSSFAQPWPFMYCKMFENVMKRKKT